MAVEGLNEWNADMTPLTRRSMEEILGARTVCTRSTLHCSHFQRRTLLPFRGQEWPNSPSIAIHRQVVGVPFSGCVPCSGDRNASSAIARKNLAERHVHQSRPPSHRGHRTSTNKLSVVRFLGDQFIQTINMPEVVSPSHPSTYMSQIDFHCSSEKICRHEPVSF